MSMTSISSLREFFEWREAQAQLLQRYNESIYDYVAPIDFECFFRGSSAHYHKLTPSIYRSTARLQNEDKIVADCLAQRPQDFRDDKSTFERLVRMQHYGIPTRLLDVTQSPLVALYFAVQNQKEEVGKLTTVFVAQRSIKYADSDTVSVVANIAHMPDCWCSLITSNLYQDYLKTQNDDAEQKYLTEYNKRAFMQKLHQQILREKPYFQPRMVKDDLERVWCVIPPMNNERIRRQQGAFLLFGIAGKKRHCIDIIEKEHAELLLDALDMTERLAISNAPYGTAYQPEEKGDMLQRCANNLGQYFSWDAQAVCNLNNAWNRLSPSSYNFGDDIRNDRGKFFHQILEDSASKIIVAESKLSANEDVPDLEDLIRFKFFRDLVYDHRAIFQTSVEVRNKSGILQELKDLGITKSYLFPDLSSVGEEINARYPVNQGKETLS